MTSNERFRSAGKSVMGDSDSHEFSFNYSLSDSELLTLLERNPRISMQCDWMVAEALKNGFQVDEEEYLQKIHFYEKLHNTMMWTRLHGSALIVFFNEGGKPNFESYHRLGNGVGWQVNPLALDATGQPTEFIVYIGSDKDFNKNRRDVYPAKQCLVFKNPKKSNRWDGTPSSALIAHTALLEELLLRCMGDYALKASGFDHYKIADEETHQALEEALAERPLSELYTSPDVTIERKEGVSLSEVSGFQIMDEIYKNYMANGMRVSQQSMDGAPEGTQSSAKYNTIMTEGSIQEIQQHFSPYILDLLNRLGISMTEIVWNKPILEDEGEEDISNSPSAAKSKPKSKSSSR